tara:strand:- start:142 stop:339 length:198 start_codon:yes stop_codon:yes gene_type:complete
MNKKVAKQLRKICNPVDPVSRRVYQRLKKQYNKLPRHAKRDFINILRETTFDLEQEQSGSILDQE